MNKIPKEMRAVAVNGITGKLESEIVPVPVPQKGEVLVKISAAPVNPSDLARIKKVIAEGRSEGFVPGIEGSGVVVSSGGGLIPKLWLGRRVACSAFHHFSGTWAEYTVTKGGLCFPLRKNVSDEQGAMTLVNPLTALEFIAMARRGRHRTVISNAAASSLGRMIEYLAMKENTGVINIVRSSEKAEQLKQSGSKHVLISSSSDFETELRDLAADTGATLLFDPVCSSELNKMISALPHGSEVVVYGNLTGEEYIKFNPRELIDRDIKISGFYLANTAASNGMLKNMISLMKAGSLMAGGMESKVRVRYRINEAQEAIDSYLSNMSAGKVLLVP